jgi:hypothetical protein
VRLYKCVYPRASNPRGSKTHGYEDPAFQADSYTGLEGHTFITAWSSTCGHTCPPTPFTQTIISFIFMIFLIK